MALVKKQKTIVSSSTKTHWSNGCLRHPEWVFMFFCGFHFLLWILVPFFSHANIQLDVVEGFVWGQEWQWGYHKHPPLPSWIVELFLTPFGVALWPGFLLSQICVLLTFAAVWRFGKKMFGPLKALASVVMLEGIIFYNFTSPEFNHNVLLLAIWSWAIFAFYKAFKRQSNFMWSMVGLLMGLGCLTKYVTVLIGAVFFLYMVTTQRGREAFKTAGPYLALAVCAIVVYPHFKWAMEHDWVTVSYFIGRSAGLKTWWHHVVFPLDFLFTQVLFLLPVGLLTLAFRKQFSTNRVLSPLSESAEGWERQFIAFMAFGPLVLTLIISLLGGFKLRSMWSMPFFSYVPLCIVTLFIPYITADSLKKFLKGTMLLMVVTAFSYVAVFIGEPYVLHRAKRVHFPGQAMASIITQEWRQLTHQPLLFVVGELWEGGNISFYSPDHPSLLLDGSFRIAPWINPSKLLKAGGVIVWLKRNHVGIPENYARLFPNAILQPPLKLAYQTEASLGPVEIGWAIIPPRKEGSDHSET